MTTTGRRHLVLDTGALLGVERAVPRVGALLREAAAVGCRFTVPAGVVAQAWRGGPRQAAVARLLSDRSVAVTELDGRPLVPSACCRGVRAIRTSSTSMSPSPLVSSTPSW
jgi:hypothetical protein